MRRLISLATAAVFFLGITAPVFAQAPRTTTTAPTSSAVTSPGANVKQFKSESEAKSGCAGDAVVWGNTSSKVLHASGSRYYGKTKNGAYMCQRQAVQAGYHAAKNGQ